MILAQQCEMCDRLRKDFETVDYAHKRLELMYYDLRARFKEKSTQWMIRKEIHKEKEQVLLDESLCGISLAESEVNNFEEKCSYQQGFEIDLLLDD